MPWPPPGYGFPRRHLPPSSRRRQAGSQYPGPSTRAALNPVGQGLNERGPVGHEDRQGERDRNALITIIATGQVEQRLVRRHAQPPKMVSPRRHYSTGSPVITTKHHFSPRASRPVAGQRCDPGTGRSHPWRIAASQGEPGEHAADECHGRDQQGHVDPVASIAPYLEGAHDGLRKRGEEPAVSGNGLGNREIAMRRLCPFCPLRTERSSPRIAGELHSCCLSSFRSPVSRKSAVLARTRRSMLGRRDSIGLPARSPCCSRPPHDLRDGGCGAVPIEAPGGASMVLRVHIRLFRSRIVFESFRS